MERVEVVSLQKVIPCGISALDPQPRNSPTKAQERRQPIVASKLPEAEFNHHLLTQMLKDSMLP
jgi:hypothetical protein